MKNLLVIIVVLLLSTIIKAQNKNPTHPVTQETTVDEMVESHLGPKMATINDTSVFMATDTIPRFPGGIAEFYKYAADNLKKNENKGRVGVNFIVEKDGSLSHIKVVRHLSDSADKEAERIISESPKWIPAKQNGIIVRYEYVMAIVFN